jgi:hypothetical protein
MFKSRQECVGLIATGEWTHSCPLRGQKLRLSAQDTRQSEITDQRRSGTLPLLPLFYLVLKIAPLKWRARREMPHSDLAK